MAEDAVARQRRCENHQPAGCQHITRGQEQHPEGRAERQDGAAFQHLQSVGEQRAQRRHDKADHDGKPQRVEISVAIDSPWRGHEERKAEQARQRVDEEAYQKGQQHAAQDS